MMSRSRALVRLLVVLLLIGGATTDCAWLKRMRQTPRRHWWEFWKPKRPTTGDLFYPKDIEPPPPPPPAPGIGSVGTDTVVPIDQGIKPPVDVAGGVPERVRPTRPAGVITQLQTVYFDFDRYDLKPEARKTLDENADFLVANPDVRILIEGHCDERGTREYNMNLGQRRADAVREYLISKGIIADRMSTISYGEERPVDLGHSEGAWAKNRRAQFQIYQ